MLPEERSTSARRLYVCSKARSPVCCGRVEHQTPLRARIERTTRAEVTCLEPTGARRTHHERLGERVGLPLFLRSRSAVALPAPALLLLCARLAPLASLALQALLSRLKRRLVPSCGGALEGRPVANAQRRGAPLGRLREEAKRALALLLVLMPARRGWAARERLRRVDSLSAARCAECRRGAQLAEGVTARDARLARDGRQAVDLSLDKWREGRR